MNQIKKILLSIFILSIGIQSGWTQEDPLSSQYMYNKGLINPAYVGSSNWIINSVNYRKQFVGIEGAPQSGHYLFHTPIQKKNMGIGLKLMNDQLSAFNNTLVNGIFSYHIGFGSGKLSFGLEAGAALQNADFSKLETGDDITDPTIPTSSQSFINPDASVGVLFQSKTFYAGLTARHFLSLDKNAPYLEQEDYFQTPSLLALGGYYWDISRDFTLEPSVLVKYYKTAPIQADINCNAVFYNRFAVGLSYRSGDAVSFLTKINITEGLRLIYSYDYTLSTLGKASSGAHEITITYGIKLLPPARQQEVHPRYYF